MTIIMIPIIPILISIIIIIVTVITRDGSSLQFYTWLHSMPLFQLDCTAYNDSFWEIIVEQTQRSQVKIRVDLKSKDVAFGLKFFEKVQ